MKFFSRKSLKITEPSAARQPDKTSRDTTVDVVNQPKTARDEAISKSLREAALVRAEYAAVRASIRKIREKNRAVDRALLRLDA